VESLSVPDQIDSLRHKLWLCGTIESSQHCEQ